MNELGVKDNTKPLFDFTDIFYSCYSDGESGCFHQSHDHAMNYVYSGEMIVDDGKKKTCVRKGESVFIRRDHRVTLYKNPAGGERYCGIFLTFNRKFLRKMYQKLEQDKVPANTPKLKTSVIKLPKTLEIESLFSSMVPYFNSSVQPHQDFMELKLQEGLFSLLHIDAKFSPTLFDFNEPWKIDIIDFLNQNYMYELSMEELAHYTGRSLATFKRDFKKLSPLTPQKWVIKKRLEAAHDKIRQGGMKIQDVYMEVGFKNPSHFSTAFKKEYGVSPTAL